MSVRIKLWIEKLWKVYKSLVLEIAALLFMTSVLMTYLTMQDFVIARVCRVNLGYSDSVCEAVVQNNGNYTNEETNIQKVMTKIRITRAVLDYTFPIIFVILQGSWSDHARSRKLPLLLPCFGITLQALALAIMGFFFQNLDGFLVVLICTIPKSLSGSDVTFRMGALSYASDVSNKNGRTLRTGLISAAFTLGVPLGFAMGGIAMKAHIKNEVAFLISAAIGTLAFSLIALFSDNNKCPVPNHEAKTSSPEENDFSSRTQQKNTWLSVKNITFVIKSLIFSFDGLILVLAIICINAPIQGEFGVMYLYLRKKVSWDLGDYGIFSTYVSLIGVSGTILSMGIMCSLLKLSDPVIGFVAGISQFAGCFMYAFAYSNLMIYMAPAIDMLNGTMAVVAKSMLSKLCSPEDFGKMFSFLAVIELLVPLIFDPTYSSVYAQTMDTFPGAVFILSAILTVPPQLTYLFYILRNRNAVTCEISDTSRVEGLSPRNKSKRLEPVAGENSGVGHPPCLVVLKSAVSTNTMESMIL